MAPSFQEKIIKGALTKVAIKAPHGNIHAIPEITKANIPSTLPNLLICFYLSLLLNYSGEQDPRTLKFNSRTIYSA